MTINQKLAQRVAHTHSLLCVGLDADWRKIPQRYRKSKTPQYDFNRWIIEETQEHVCAFKPNSAFYEARGDQGWQELKLTFDYLKDKHPDIVTILDAKRADIGSTNEGYVASIFDWLGADAVTVQPYLGQEAVQPFLDRKDKVSIILCRTSNPGAGEFQDLETGGQPLWQAVAKQVRDKWNKQDNCWLVVGATYPKEMAIIRQLCPQMNFLVPGVGAQGGDLSEVLRAGRRADGAGLIINSSRGVIFAADPGKAIKELAEVVRFELT